MNNDHEVILPSQSPQKKRKGKRLSLQKKKPKLELTERTSTSTGIPSTSIEIPSTSIEIPSTSTVTCENDVIPSSQSPLYKKYHSNSSLHRRNTSPLETIPENVSITKRHELSIHTSQTSHKNRRLSLQKKKTTLYERPSTSTNPHYILNTEYPSKETSSTTTKKDDTQSQNLHEEIDKRRTRDLLLHSSDNDNEYPLHAYIKKIPEHHRAAIKKQKEPKLDIDIENCEIIVENGCSDFFEEPCGNPYGREVRFLINSIATKECVHDFYDLKPTKLSTNLKEKLTDVLKIISNNAIDPSSETVYTTERNEEGQLKLVLVPRKQTTINDVFKYLNNQNNSITNKQNIDEDPIQSLSVKSCDLISNNNYGADKIDENNCSVLSDCNLILSPNTPNKSNVKYGKEIQKKQSCLSPVFVSNNTIMKSMKQNRIEGPNNDKPFPRNISGLLNKTILDNELQELETTNNKCNNIQAFSDFGDSAECMFTSTPKRARSLDTSTDFEQYDLTDVFNLMDNLEHQNKTEQNDDGNISDSTFSSFHGFTTSDLLPTKNCDINESTPVCNTPTIEQPITIKRKLTSGKRLGIGRLKMKFNMFNANTLKSSLMFKDVDKEIEQNFRQGFSTINLQTVKKTHTVFPVNYGASGSKTSVTKFAVNEESMKKATQLLSDLDEGVLKEFNTKTLALDKTNNKYKPVNKQTATEFQQISVPSLTNFGFRTGLNKEIKIKEESLKKSMKLFADIVDDPVQLMETKNKFNEMNTVNSKTVPSSEEYLDSYELNKLIKTVDKVSEIGNIENVEKLQFNAVDTQFTGFKTGTNKPIAVRESSKNRAMQLFQNIDKEPAEVLENNVQERQTVNLQSISNIDLSTEILNCTNALLDDNDDW